MAKIPVYCGYGPGIVLRLFKFVDKQLPGGANGWHTERIAEETARVTVAGGSRALVGQPAAKPKFAVTMIEESFWTEWVKQSGGDCELMRCGLLFAAGDRRRGKDQAKESASILSGLEPLNMARRLIGRHRDSDAPLYRPVDERLARDGLASIMSDDGSSGIPGTTHIGI